MNTISSTKKKDFRTKDAQTYVKSISYLKNFADWKHLSTLSVELLEVPYFSDHKAHLKSFNFLKNRKCAL